MAEANGEYALATEELTKEFGKLRAVDGVTLRVPVGERRAIIGPNGAGKTTLFNLISGELPVTSGEIFMFGHNVTAMPPHRRVEFKLGRTYQITNIFQGLSVKENVFLAVQGLSNLKYSLERSIPNAGPVHERVISALRSTGLEDKANPLATPEHVKPEWYFLSVYQFLKVASIFSFLGAEAPRLIGIFLPAIGLGALFLLPFLERGPKRVARQRPVMLIVLAVTLIVIIVFTVWGQCSGLPTDFPFLGKVTCP